MAETNKCDCNCENTRVLSIDKSSGLVESVSVTIPERTHTGDGPNPFALFSPQHCVEAIQDFLNWVYVKHEAELMVEDKWEFYPNWSTVGDEWVLIKEWADTAPLAKTLIEGEYSND